MPDEKVHIDEVRRIEDMTMEELREELERRMIETSKRENSPTKTERLLTLNEVITLTFKGERA